MLKPTLSRALWLSLWLSLGLGFLACERLRMKPVLNEAGEIVKLTPLWSYPLHEQEPTSNSIVDAPLVFEQKVLIATTHGPDQRALTCVDVQTGEPLWRWNDIFNAPWEKLSVYDAYVHSNILFYSMGGRHYAIDLKTGETLWRTLRHGPFSSKLSGWGDTFFTAGDPIDTLEADRVAVGYRGSIETGEIEQFLFPKEIKRFEQEGGVVLYTSFDRIEPFEIDGRLYLAATSSDSYPNWHYTIMLSLYDYEAGEWVFDRKLVAPPSQSNVGVWVRYYDGRIYVSAGNRIVCFDWADGRQVWSREFVGGFEFAGFIVKDGRVIAHAGNLGETVYGLDAATGQKLWEAEGAGTSSQLEGRYLNGIVYFSGGGTGRIHAIDCETGETVWRLDPGEIEKDAQDWKPDLYVVPGQNGEKGRVVACTPLNAYCFEAYR